MRGWAQCLCFFSLSAGQLASIAGTVAESKWQNGVNKSPSFLGRVPKGRAPGNQEVLKRLRRRGDFGKRLIKLFISWET